MTPGTMIRLVVRKVPVGKEDIAEEVSEIFSRILVIAAVGVGEAAMADVVVASASATPFAATGPSKWKSIGDWYSRQIVF